MRNTRAGAFTASLVLSASCLSIFGFAACGGGAAKPVIVPAPGADAGADSSSSAARTTPPPAGLPPMSPMPPPGVTGSKKAKRRVDDALVACAGAAKPAAKDVVDHLKRVGDACAAASKMHPLGAPFRGQQADKDAHAEHKVKVEANKCYRVYFATDEGVRDAVVAVRDSAGDMVADSGGGAAAPTDGAMCFTTADEVTLLIGVGSGKGAYAAQVWSD